MSNCENQPIPVMFEKKEKDYTEMGIYLERKHPALSHLIGKPETIYLYYSAVDFTNLLDAIANTPGATGVRIYFASYCNIPFLQTGSKDINAIISSGFADLLTLIFAPGQDKNDPDIGSNCYMVNPTTGGVFTITSDIKNVLTNQYLNVKLPLLEAIINNRDFHETKYMWLSLDDLNGKCSLRSEIECEGASGVSAFIGCFKKDKVLTFGGKVGYQLTIIFELAKIIKYNNIDYIYHFNIEDDAKSYNNRQKLPPPQSRGFDTINPCPPTCY